MSLSIARHLGGNALQMIGGHLVALRGSFLRCQMACHQPEDKQTM